VSSEQTPALDQRGYFCFKRGLLLAAREYLELWCDVVREREPGRVCEALNALGSVYIELGEAARAMELFAQSLDWERAGSKVHRIHSLCNMSLCCYLMGRATECVSYGEQAFQLLLEEKSPDPDLEAHTHEILSLGYVAVGDWERAAVAAEAARKSFEATGDKAGVAKMLNNLGLIRIETGKYDEGESLLNASLRLMESLQDSAQAAYTYTELGRLCFKRKDLAGALRFGSKALRLLWDNMGMIDKAEIARLCELFGSIAHSVGDRQGAITYLQRASTYYAQQDRWREWQGANESLARVIRGEPGEHSEKIAIDIEDRERLRYLTTLLGLMDTLECFYPTLRGKSELVTKYALLIGERCGLAAQDLERLSHAARLHDIGLTSMDAGAGEPAGTLGEGAAVHAVFGERILKMFGVHEEVQKAVRHQREWFDGSGSPDGLAGSEIPLFSRIIAVAEAYIATTLACPDPRRSHSEGMRAVAALSGRRFDPVVIDRFIRLHEEDM